MTNLTFKGVTNTQFFIISFLKELLYNKVHKLAANPDTPVGLKMHQLAAFGITIGRKVFFLFFF